VSTVPQSRLTNPVVRTDSRPRTKVTAALIALAAIVCLARLLQWQVVERDRLLAAAASQSSASIVQSPPRGTITDSSGVVVLATTVMRYRLTALPGRIVASERPVVAVRLAGLIGGEAGDADRIRALLESGRTRVTIHPGLDDAAAESIRSAVS
jgi:cell division protein FtsI/penicillin-binding protein 2